MRSTTQGPWLRRHPETGEARTFHKAEDIPPDWLHRHPDDPLCERPRPSPAPAPEPEVEPAYGLEVQPMPTRADIIAKLVELGIPHSKNAPTRALYNQAVKAIAAAE